MNRQKMKIIPKLLFVEDTYAEITGNTIRIHKDLMNYDKDSYFHALKHEKGHYGNTFLEDLIHDFKDLKHIRIHFKAFRFMLKHPKVIIKMASPLWWDKKSKRLEYNPVLFVFYGLYALFFIFLSKIW